MTNLAKKTQDKNLFEKYIELKTAKPELRAIDCARELSVTEGELAAARVGTDVTRLTDTPEEILLAVKALDEVMALTRNESCVHERKGVYDNGSFQNTPHMKMGLFVNPDIDLRLFMNHWKYCFAALEQTKGGPRKSLQFFSKQGVALHKIYLTNKSNEAEYEKLVEKFKAPTQETSITIEPDRPEKADLPDSEIDVKNFRKAWEELKDTHDFHPMLMKFKVGREQALRLAGEDLAYKVSNQAFRKTLELARDKNCEIMVFVGNKGCIQIHTGTVNKLLEYGTWFNVMDPAFNLHLDESRISSIWVTKKPTDDGIVTALEIFDEKNELIATLFGKRKPGIPELELWREIISEVE